MKKYYKLTAPQENIYLREEYYNCTSINNISFTYCIHKKLDLNICQKVINNIIEYNEGLRLRITKQNNNIVQYISEFEKENIEIVNYFDKDMEFIKNEMAEDAKIPFDFYNNKLYKFKIYVLPNNRTGIYIKLHHIIADAWVCKILLKQFNNMYNNFNTEEEKTLIKYTYIDFINEEEKYYSSDLYKKDEKYWKEYLKEMPEAIQFKDSAMKEKSNSIRFTKYISIDLSKEINLFCKNKKITPYSFFIAVYATYLKKTLGKSNFTIGTPLLNRKDYKERQTVGMFVSTIPLKIKINEEDTVEELVARISIDIKNALKHQRYPYSKMLEYAKKQNENINNLFDTILSFQNMKPDKEYIDYRYNHFWNFSGNQQSSFEMHISDYNDKGQYLLNLDFKKDIINEKEMKLIFNRFVYLIENIIKDEKQLINNLEYIPAIEKIDLKFKFNKEAPNKAYKTITQLFSEQTIRNSEKIALKLYNKKLTYNELNEKVNSMANFLIKKGIKEDMPVTLLLDRSFEMIISMLAVLKIGAYYIPVDPNWPFERLNYIVNDSESKYIITNNKYRNEEIDVNWIDVEQVDFSDSFSEIENKSDLDKLAYIIYTSGTTGKPKGTLITNKNVVGLLNSTNKLFKQNSSDIWTLFHTYTFDFSTWEIYGCLVYGGTLVIVPKEITTNPKEFLNLLIKEKVTILNQTPAYFYKVIEQEKISKIDKENINVRLVILGGEAVHAEPLKYWKEKYEKIIIYNGYGPTETTIFAVMGEITKEDIQRNNIYIGHPLENYKVQILDKNMNMLPIGYNGEICISGSGVCNGYLNNELLNSEKFIRNNKDQEIVYKSGDVGYFDVDGRIKYMGRNDNQVKIRGFRIETEEIEKQLLNCDGVTKAIVFPVEDQNYTKKLVGFIETQKEDCTELVINQIKKHLTPYMIPKLYQSKEFPLNDNGKVDRRRLLENISQDKKKVIKPTNSIENDILKVISNIAEEKNISITDDFFIDLNLDSLDIMQLATMLNKYELSIQDINEYSNIRDLAKQIETEKKGIINKNIYQDVKVINKNVKFDLTNILLTGATGFLGIHILKELIKNPSTRKVYCLVRKKNNISPKERFKKILDYYFTNDDMKYLEKIEVIEGNFESKDLGLQNNDYKKLLNNVNTIIHCGANVSHYGKYEKFYKSNVKGTKNIIEFATKCNAKLAHISTLSVGGFCSINETKTLNENSININQDFRNHVYMITKYEAECEVLKAIKNKKIEAKIFRLGNIMPRLSDGKFQINKMDNGFLCRLRTILNTHSITEQYKKIKIDISPVDLCSKAIICLLKDNNNQTIYHINNNKLINVEEIIRNMDINEVSTDDQIEIIRKLNDPYNAHLLSDLMNKDFIEMPTTNELTVNELEKLGFEWNKIDFKYINNLIGLIKGVKNEKIEGENI